MWRLHNHMCYLIQGLWLIIRTDDQTIHCQTRMIFLFHPYTWRYTPPVYKYHAVQTQLSLLHKKKRKGKKHKPDGNPHLSHQCKFVFSNQKKIQMKRMKWKKNNNFPLMVKKKSRIRVWRGLFVWCHTSYERITDELIQTWFTNENDLSESLCHGWIRLINNSVKGAILITSLRAPTTWCVFSGGNWNASCLLLVLDLYPLCALGHTDQMSKMSYDVETHSPVLSVSVLRSTVWRMTIPTPHYKIPKSVMILKQICLCGISLFFLYTSIQLFGIWAFCLFDFPSYSVSWFKTKT